MTWLAFTLGVVLGVIGTLLWLVLIDLMDNEDPLDSEAEYVDNTPTFR
jgi:hypothetical protein